MYLSEKGVFTTGAALVFLALFLDDSSLHHGLAYYYTIENFYCWQMCHSRARASIASNRATLLPLMLGELPQWWLPEMVVD
jgi:hypothetical protein